nr:hypothetical protein [uncultured Dysosmobacter sp.]
MYNRYIRNDNGSYTRIPQEEPPKSAPPSPLREAAEQRERQPPFPEAEKQEGGDRRPFTAPSPPPPKGGGPGRLPDGLTGFLRHILDQLHLDHVDTGDLLLLILLFFLFREDADEELLVSLGLLLIL